MNGKYVYDKDDFRFRTQKRTARRVVLRILKYFIASISLAVIYYIIFAVFFSTDRERELKSENRMYSRLYPELEQKQDLLSGVVAGLEVKDNTIYNDLFQTDVVAFDNRVTTDFLADNDSLGVVDIIKYSEKRFSALHGMSEDIDTEFEKIFSLMSSDTLELPPLNSPVSGFSVNTVGASIGERINPFYKVKVMHNGLDIVVPAGTPVIASADGVVSSVVRSKKGLGNVVEISHGGGYFTKYAHLSDIKVLRGRKVTKGALLGKVGISGNAFVPHLHYEVRRDSLVLDPVNCFFGSVTPEDYGYMLLLSASAGQSMD